MEFVHVARMVSLGDEAPAIGYHEVRSWQMDSSLQVTASADQEYHSVLSIEPENVGLAKLGRVPRSSRGRQEDLR